MNTAKPYLSALEERWMQPPPGTSIVTEGLVQQGDWFYIQKLGVWAPVPAIGWGEKIHGALIARGPLDFTQVDAITPRAFVDLAAMNQPPNAKGQP